MLQQAGITVLELLIGLSIMSGVSLYTMKMTEKVEDAITVYQDRAVDVEAIKEKLKLVQQSNQEENEALLQMMDGDILEEYM